jgi:hypothetical protein
MKQLSVCNVINLSFLSALSQYVCFGCSSLDQSQLDLGATSWLPKAINIYHSLGVTNAAELDNED